MSGETVGTRDAGPAWREGMSAATGVPALVLASGYVGYGALAADYSLSLTGTLLSTLLIWALPGQLILVEMHQVGAPVLLILLTVMFSAVRFLPMTVVMMPLLREAHSRPLHHYAAAQLLSMTGWAWAMVRFPAMPPGRRLSYFMGFTSTLLAAAMAATAFGYLGGDRLPPLGKLALVFMSPMYFLLLLAGETRQALGRFAVVCGALSGPVLHLALPQASVLATGLIGGTAGYLLHRAWKRRREK